jgi:hypothetical protein
MLLRKRRDVVHYYYATKGTDRKEIPLGSSYRVAIERYKAIVESEELGTVPVPSEIHAALFRKVTKSASTRKIPIDLTERDVQAMIERSGLKCEVSGIKFDMRKVPGMRIRPWAPSIDRIKPSLSYTAENCRVVCAAVNLALNQFGDDVFFAIAQSIVRKRQ